MADGASANPNNPPPPQQRSTQKKLSAWSDGADSDGDGDGDHGTASSSRSHLVPEFIVALGRKVLGLAELRRLACQCVPDAAGVRPVV
ncbi:hypothetical protein E2562_020000 [Oryza meyeriana var. granulata]|uniref:Uncharacterized protein n=1 Tax=Oryza meyeriana var. granulata TaxID=110450 RepID=A0A6G1CGA1_9ORYZ|nr:hypothetical protein E2562_020000 [Oryza meyeriana var. granulata]